MPGCATEAEIRASFADQAGWCDKLAAVFTAGLCRLLGERLNRATEAGRRVLAWPGNPSVFADNVPLRLCGALQALARSGRHPELAACYPPKQLPISFEIRVLKAAAESVRRNPAQSPHAHK